MKISTLLAATVLCAAPIFASTYYGGVEDLKSGSDYDYNDLVFSLSGSSLQLITSDGKWYTQPVLGINGTPFWNNGSFDGNNDQERHTYNVGYCIYGGGACNNGNALQANAQYLAATNHTFRSAKDVSFTTAGGVDTNVYLAITAATDVLGWYDTSNPSDIHWINAGGATGDFYFTPGSSFGLAVNTANAQTNKKGVLQGDTYYSQATYGTKDFDSHFAFFTPAPEPGLMGLVGAGLLGVGMLFRRREN